MTLRTKLLLITLTPFLIITLVQLLSIQRIITKLEYSMADDRASDLTDVERNLLNLMRDMDYASINLSRPREIRNALERADNEILYDWSSSFIGKFDTVIFTDQNGIVISRAPDEFRFGDMLREMHYFKKAVESEIYLGTAVLDEHHHLVAARRIDKYTDLPLGVAIVAVRITPDLLRELTRHRSDLYLTYRQNDTVISSALPGSEIHFTAAIGDENTEQAFLRLFELSFALGENYRSLKILEQRLIIASIVTALSVIAALILVLRLQFQPYTRMATALLSYSEENQNLKKLQKQLSRIDTTKSTEADKIISSILELLSVIETDISHIEQIASKDTLTGLNNRRTMDLILKSEVERCNKLDLNMTLAILDIDHFKSVNDTYGHQTGDAVLKIIGGLLGANSRSSDHIGRWGGEEFLIICPNTGLDKSSAFVEKLRKVIQGAKPENGIKLTGSFGISEFRKDDSAASILERADRALYRAKEEGRNRVVIE